MLITATSYRDDGEGVSELNAHLKKCRNNKSPGDLRSTMLDDLNGCFGGPFLYKMPSSCS